MFRRALGLTLLSAISAAACGDDTVPPPPPPPPPPGSFVDIKGTIYEPFSAMATLTAGMSFAKAGFMSSAAVAGAKVCVLGAMPEACSMPSAADGSFTVSAPVDLSPVTLTIVPAAAGDFQETHVLGKFDLTKTPPENKTITREGATPEQWLFGVTKANPLAAVAVAAGLAQAGAPDAVQKVLEKGAAVIWGEEFPKPNGTDLELVPNCDFDTNAGQLWSLTADANGVTATNLETANPDAQYPLPSMVLLGTGAAATAQVICTRPLDARPYTLDAIDIELVPGAVVFARPLIYYSH